MNTQVREYFPNFTDRYEGRIAFMYLDVLGLVTTGRGNLIDPMTFALSLPWRRKDSSLADQPTIIAEWTRIKSLQSMKQRGGWAYGAYATLHLDDQAVNDLTFSKLDQLWGQLLRRWPLLEQWPADAQLGLLSMAWAMGSEFKFPHFEAYADVQNWAGCAQECTISTVGNPGVAPRNTANRILFTNASMSPNPEQLYYPVAITPKDNPGPIAPC